MSPGVSAGGRNDTWRDCAVARITYFEQRTADTTLDRATALKFLSHVIGDLHQPFHAHGVGRGGSAVIVRVFGNGNCGNDPNRPPLPCNALGGVGLAAVLNRALATPPQKR